MGKLQPNFSWQKYEGQPEDQKQQFQYQLQTQHIQVANSVNTIIDDESFFTRERQTSFAWIDNRAIYTKTITGVVVGSTTTPYPHGITGLNKVILLQGSAQNAQPITTFALPLPYIDPVTLLNSIGIFVDNTNLYLNVGNAAFSGYLFSVTIYYTKIQGV